MSKLIFFLTRVKRWTKRYERLGSVCQLYWFSRLTTCKNIGETLPKLSCLAPATTQKILRQPTCLNSLGIIIPLPRKTLTLNLLSSTDTGKALRVASIGPEFKTCNAASDDREIIPYDDSRRRTEASDHLQKLLGLDAETANRCARYIKIFAIIDVADIEKNYLLMRRVGFSETVVRESPEILLYPHTILEEKISLILHMNLANVDDMFPFFELDEIKLRLFSRKMKKETELNNGVNRITYLTEQLECPMRTVCRIMTNYPFMRKIKFRRIRDIMDIMKDFNLAKDDIINDIWAFAYTPDLITKRFKIATDAGVSPIKPWMIRCPESILYKTIAKETRRRTVLGENGTIFQYLLEKFDCDETKITQLIVKCPQIMRVSGPKIKQIIDFLLENGYTIDHLIRLPRLIFTKPETMRERLAEITQYGHKPKSLSIFVQNRRKYTVSLETIKRKWLKTNGG